MTIANTTTTNRRIPLIYGDQVILYDAADGYTGYVAIDDEIHRITLTRKPTARAVVFEVACPKNVALITGTVFGNEAPGALGKTGKALPHLTGRIAVAGKIDRNFELAVWMMTAASGSRYYFGCTKPSPYVDAAIATGGVSPPMSSGVALPGRPAP